MSDKSEEIKKCAELIYNNIDYDNPEPSVFNAKVFQDQAHHTEALLKSGLHPSYLTADQRKAIRQEYGPKWYLQFGYEKRDIKSI
jgi:hypothetical protein